MLVLAVALVGCAGSVEESEPAPPPVAPNQPVQVVVEKPVLAPQSGEMKADIATHDLGPDNVQK